MTFLHITSLVERKKEVVRAQWSLTDERGFVETKNTRDVVLIYIYIYILILSFVPFFFFIMTSSSLSFKLYWNSHFDLNKVGSGCLFGSFLSFSFISIVDEFLFSTILDLQETLYIRSRIYALLILLLCTSIYIKPNHIFPTKGVTFI